MKSTVSDRITGVVLLLLSAGCGLQARGFTTGFITDPLGPSAFPMLLAVVLGAAAIAMIVKPDPDPQWATGSTLLHQALTLITLVAYAFLLEPLGFPLATFLAMAVIGRQLGAPWGKSILMAAISSISLFVLFDVVLDLPLPLAPDFGG